MPRAKAPPAKKKAAPKKAQKKVAKAVKKVAPKVAVKKAARATLTYFQVHGKNEPIVMLLHQAGVDYDFERISREQFHEMKASGALPAGQVPLWRGTDGALKNQSNAILRMLGR